MKCAHLTEGAGDCKYQGKVPDLDRREESLRKHEQAS